MKPTKYKYNPFFFKPQTSVKPHAYIFLPVSNYLLHEFNYKNLHIYDVFTPTVLHKTPEINKENLLQIFFKRKKKNEISSK